MKVVKVSAEVTVPQGPNFLRLADGSGVISIADVEDEALRRLGSEWTEDLIRRANVFRQRKAGSK